MILKYYATGTNDLADLAGICNLNEWMHHKIKCGNELNRFGAMSRVSLIQWMCVSLIPFSKKRCLLVCVIQFPLEAWCTIPHTHKWPFSFQAREKYVLKHIKQHTLFLGSLSPIFPFIFMNELEIPTHTHTHTTVCLFKSWASVWEGATAAPLFWPFNGSHSHTHVGLEDPFEIYGLIPSCLCLLSHLKIVIGPI